MKNLFAAEWAILVLFQFAGNILTVLCSCIILSFALCALKGNNINCCLFFATHSNNSPKKIISAPERNRTADLRTTNAVLYRLSYKSKLEKRVF